MAIMQKFFAACQGRHTAAICAFFVTGNVFHFLHRLDATYIGFMTTLMGFILGHSFKEDWAAKNGVGQNPGNGNGNGADQNNAANS